MVEGSCPFRRRSEELAADVRLLGDGSPELYPESLIVREWPLGMSRLRGDRGYGDRLGRPSARRVLGV